MSSSPDRLILPRKDSGLTSILFLTPQVPYPPHQGAALRNYNLIKNLAQHHEITLLSFGDPDDETGRHEMRRFCRRVEVIRPNARPRLRRLAGLLAPAPDLARRLASPQLVARLRTLISEESFDAVQIEGLEMAPSWQAIGAGQQLVTVLDEHNAEYVLQRRAFEIDCRLGGNLVGAAYSLIQFMKLRRFESRVCQAADAVVAVSEADRRALLALAPSSLVGVVPNGVDTDYYRPMQVQPPSVPTLVFTGTMDFRPNVDAVAWFCRQVLPKVQEAEPGARLRIVGRNPTPEVRRLSRTPGVEVTGWVADDRPHIAGATAYVVPMRMGGGVRLKLLQAMAMGLPVVSTSLGAEGVTARSGEELIVADGEQDFAQAVVGVLRDAALRARLGAAARPAVASRYDWRVIAPALEELYFELAAKTRGVRSAGAG